MVLNFCNILVKENVTIVVWSDCIPFVCVLCAHACVCVIILTPLFVSICKVSIVIIPYMQCCIQGFASSSSMMNIFLARIIYKIVYTSNIIFITFVLFCGLGECSQYS